jgi:selenocysteine lyase/cysteine desulfurase
MPTSSFSLDQVSDLNFVYAGIPQQSSILGSTGAIHKLVGILHLADKENRANTVVFFTAFEHHSNILPWKEIGLEVKEAFHYIDRSSMSATKSIEER